MSYFEDYVEDGLCCEECGEMIDGSEPGYVRKCEQCSGRKRNKVRKSHKR